MRKDSRENAEEGKNLPTAGWICRTMKNVSWVVSLFLGFTFFSSLAGGLARADSPGRTFLNDGWALQSSAKVQGSGIGSLALTALNCSYTSY